MNIETEYRICHLAKRVGLLIIDNDPRDERDSHVIAC